MSGSADRGAESEAPEPDASDPADTTGDRHDDDVYEEQQIVDPPDLDQA